MKTWRKHRFEAGKKYKVLKAVRTLTSELVTGEDVIFESTAYSAYDSSSAFIFKSCRNGETKTWFLHDDDDDNSAEFFTEAQ
tara:strand:- start:110 stop:355 length:246 start_codon:yes stop_codon:yes gene_type:complete